MQMNNAPYASFTVIHMSHYTVASLHIAQYFYKPLIFRQESKGCLPVPPVIDLSRKILKGRLKSFLSHLQLIGSLYGLCSYSDFLFQSWAKPR